MSAERSQSDFQKAAVAALNKTLVEYGFVARVNEGTGALETGSEQWQIVMEQGSDCIRVELRLMEEARRAPVFYQMPQEPSHRVWGEPLPKRSLDTVGLWSILEVLAPELPEAGRYPRRIESDSQIGGELAMQLGLLTQYCGQMLKGDLSQWDRVREAERYQFGFRRGDEESWEDYLSRLRRMAESAYERKEYYKACEAFNKLDMLDQPLSVGDRFRHLRAGRHVVSL